MLHDFARIDRAVRHYQHGLDSNEFDALVQACSKAW